MYKSKNILKLIFIYFSIASFLLSTNLLFSQNIINSIQVSPLNRFKISFNNLPKVFSSQLSDDKQKIIIKINESFQVVDTVLSFDGIIKQAAIIANSESCQITLDLGDRRGYTVTSLPYSNSLIVDVFQWNNLSKGEDKLRTSLIALEGNFKESAYNDLISAIKDTTKEAAVILGLNLIKESYLESAAKILEFAEKNLDTTIIELYAGLSDIYNQRNNLNRSNYYSKKYLQYSKDKKMVFLLSSYVNPEDSIFLNKLSFLDSFKVETKIDTNTIMAHDSTLVKSNDSLLTSENKIDNSIIEYFLYALFALLILIVFFYVKWRNQRIQEIINAKKIKIPNNKSENKSKVSVENKPINKILANIYKKQDEKKDDTEPESKPQKSEMEKINEQAEKTKNLLDIVKKVQDENKIKQKTDIKNQEIEQKSQTQVPARVEIALNIAKEQKRIKEQSLDEFNSILLPTDIEKLNEISKKLGIEMGGFEIRKQIDKIMKSDKEMEELKYKFTNRTE